MADHPILDRHTAHIDEINKIGSLSTLRDDVPRSTNPPVVDVVVELAMTNKVKVQLFVVDVLPTLHAGIDRGRLHEYLKPMLDRLPAW